ncbi:tetratricopeptide repeat protein 27-like protein, partial [Leptotrombidium deliense]
EAWNNLAKVYIKLNDKPRAWKTLQEALKCNYEEWRIWENYLFVSIDVGAFDDVISAWHRLIDLKSKFNDDDVLEILVKVDCGEIEVKSETFNFQKFGEKLRTLFGRIAAVAMCSSTFWKLYAKIIMRKKNNEDCDKVLNCLKKSHQSTVAKANWEKNATDIEQVLTDCCDLIEYYQKCVELYGVDTNMKTAINSCRLSTNSVLKTADMSMQYWENSENNEKINGLLTGINDKLNNLLLNVS